MTEYFRQLDKCEEIMRKARAENRATEIRIGSRSMAWDCVLNNEDLARLAQGVDPRDIRPDHIIMFAPGLGGMANADSSVEMRARELCRVEGIDPDAYSTIKQSSSGLGLHGRVLRNWEVKAMLIGGTAPLG